MGRYVRVALLIAAIAIAFAVARALAPVLIVGAVALVVLAWRRPALVEKVSGSERLTRIPARARATPMRFAAVIAAVVIPFSGVAASINTGQPVPDEPPSRVEATANPITADSPEATATPTAAPVRETATAAPVVTAAATPTATPVPTAVPTTVPTPTPAPILAPIITPAPATVAVCDPSYPTLPSLGVCIPAGVGDVYNCPDMYALGISYFEVRQPDPQGFDGNDNDGWGCEG